MITIRDESNVMIMKLDGQSEHLLRQAVALGVIPAKTLKLKDDSEHSMGFVVDGDYKLDLAPGARIYFWRGTKIFMS